MLRSGVACRRSWSWSRIWSSRNLRCGAFDISKNKDRKVNLEPDPRLRDYENVSLKEDISTYMAREVLPYVPDACVDESKTKVG